MDKTSRLIRRPIVECRVGLKRSMIYLLIAEGKFPKPVQLSVRAVAWREADIDDWIASRILKGAAA